MDEQKFKELMKKVEELKHGKEFDLSTEEDLSIGIMNLISLEEHFFLTAEKTGKSDYLDLLNETRSIRKSLLKKMISEHEGETWCISKHLLAATMRLMEVGTKYLSDGKREEAEDIFKKSYRVYALFWALRLKLLNLEGVKKIGENSLNKNEEGKAESKSENKKNEPWKFEDIINKLVDCCNE